MSLDGVKRDENDCSGTGVNRVRVVCLADAHPSMRFGCYSCTCCLLFLLFPPQSKALRADNITCCDSAWQLTWQEQQQWHWLICLHHFITSTLYIDLELTGTRTGSSHITWHKVALDRTQFSCNCLSQVAPGHHTGCRWPDFTKPMPFGPGEQLSLDPFPAKRFLCINYSRTGPSVGEEGSFGQWLTRGEGGPGWRKAHLTTGFCGKGTTESNFSSSQLGHISCLLWYLLGSLNFHLT